MEKYVLNDAEKSSSALDIWAWGLILVLEFSSDVQKEAWWYS